MAELELTPEVIKEETSAVTEQVQTQLAEVEAAAAAVAEAPLIDLEPEAEEAANPLAKFTADEQRQIRSVAEKIDITDSNAVLRYGASAQLRVSDFAGRNS